VTDITMQLPGLKQGWKRLAGGRRVFSIRT
jgi:hypothetical protein